MPRRDALPCGNACEKGSEMEPRERAVIVTFCNQKGGQGKTSAATAFSWGEARKGLRVLAIDFDAQGTLTANLAGDGIGDVPDICDWVLDGADARVAVTEGIDVVPATFDGVRRLEQHMERDFISPAGYLGKAIERSGYADAYDVVLIDTSSNINLPLTNALMASSAVIVPAEPRREGLMGFEKVWEVIELVAAQRGGSPAEAYRSVGLFVHAYKEQPRGHRDTAEEIREAAEGRGCSVYRSLIHENEPMADALGRHIDPFSRRNRIRAAREYESLIDEFNESAGVMRHG